MKFGEIKGEVNTRIYPNNKNLDTTSPLRMPCRKRKKYIPIGMHFKKQPIMKINLLFMKTDNWNPLELLLMQHLLKDALPYGLWSIKVLKSNSVSFLPHHNLATAIEKKKRLCMRFKQIPISNILKDIIDIGSNSKAVYPQSEGSLFSGYLDIICHHLCKRHFLAIHWQTIPANKDQHPSKLSHSRNCP